MWLGSLNMWIITQRLLHVRVTERERERELQELELIVARYLKSYSWLWLVYL